MKYILRNTYGIQHIDSIKTNRTPFTLDDLQFAKKIFRRPKAITGHNIVDPHRNLQGIEVKLITILRDPVMRCISHYQDDVVRRGNTQTFQEWINQETNQNLSVKIIAGSDDLSRARYLLKKKFTFTGITEKFEDSLKILKIQLNEPLNLTYARLITAKDNRIKKQLLEDNIAMRLLNKHNSLDKELYDFALNELFLPAVERHKDELGQIVIPPFIDNNKKAPNHKESIRYNKFVYRQLIKILGK